MIRANNALLAIPFYATTFYALKVQNATINTYNIHVITMYLQCARQSFTLCTYVAVYLSTSQPIRHRSVGSLVLDSSYLVSGCFDIGRLRTVFQPQALGGSVTGFVL